MAMQTSSYYIGIDCGTASVRAALVSNEGDLICSHSESIDVYNPKPDFYEQSSDNIWHKTCVSIQNILKKSGIQNIVDKIGGIGVDATCSLVVLDDKDEPLSVSPTNDKSHNIILWMDHRARNQTDFINSMTFDDEKENVLSFVGGKISIEMEIPKILWLRQHKPDTYHKASKFMDLADFLTFKLTGNDVRSICTLTCKWTFRGDLVSDKAVDSSFYPSTKGWNASFFCTLGMEDIVDANYQKFGLFVGDLGQSIGDGVCIESAKATGLTPGIAVSIGMIDAHCGAIGLLGSMSFDNDIKLYERIALICGTSTCHMMPLQQKVFVPGIWGPFYSSLMPGLWLLEGGQSSTGSLIDYIVSCFNCVDQMRAEATEQSLNVYQYLNNRLLQMKNDMDLDYVSYLARCLHINPYFHGNRSPLSDPSLQGMMVGMKLNDLSDVDQCAMYYLAALQSLCYDSKYILDTMVEKGINIKCAFATGGLAKNELFLALHADITNIPIVLPKYEDSVLIGAAVLGLLAHQKGKMSFEEAMRCMNHAKMSIQPRKDDKLKKFHESKYKVFRKMIDHFKEYQDIMKPEEEENPQSGHALNKTINIIDSLTQAIDNTIYK